MFFFYIIKVFIFCLDFLIRVYLRNGKMLMIGICNSYYFDKIWGFFYINCMCCVCFMYICYFKKNYKFYIYVFDFRFMLLFVFMKLWLQK